MNLEKIVHQAVKEALTDEIQEDVKVGDGATINFYSDRHAATVIDVSKNGRVVTVQIDKATRVDDRGMSESQDYVYERVPDGAIMEFSKRKNGRYIRAGESLNGTSLTIGVRSEYYDFSF